MKKSEWRLRYILRLVQGGVPLYLAQQDYAAGKNVHDYEGSPEEAADDELSYMAEE